jgi:uncharacterized repeat protein (TIGR04052 family)
MPQSADMSASIVRASIFFPCSLLGLLAATVGCTSAEDDGVPVSIDFALRNGGAEVGCGDVLIGLGAAASDAALLDARFYVHDVALVTSDGAELPVTLDDVAAWQSRGVALVDFADDSGACETGSAGVNGHVTGVVERTDDVVGLRFTLGVPEALNHIEADKAEAPFDEPGMFWSWTGGFKFARIDVSTPENPAWFVHLGSTGCSGAPADGYVCTTPNRPRIALDFTLGEDAVAFDLAALLAGSDLTVVPDETVDPVPGCMSGAADPQCVSIFDAFGLDDGGMPAGDVAVFKTVEASHHHD